MNKPKFGFCIPVFAGASAWDYGIGFSQMKSTIAACERLEFDSLWVPDHLTMGYKNQILECWTVLSAASQISEHLRLGTLVACVSHRSPALLAKMAATLDVISEGRLELGLGAGWRGSEQVSYGLPWERSTVSRIQRLTETIDIIKGMWTNDKFSYSGHYYAVNNAVCMPKPVQRPFPRIWLGGSGEKLVLRTVAKYADGWNVGEISPAEYARKLAVLRTHCNELSTDYDHIEKSLETLVLISDDSDDYAKVVRWSNWFGSEAQAETVEMKPAAGGLAEMKSQYILGPVGEVTERVAEYVHAGVQRFMIYFLDYPSLKSIKAFAKDVIPST